MLCLNSTLKIFFIKQYNTSYEQIKDDLSTVPCIVIYAPLVVMRNRVVPNVGVTNGRVHLTWHLVQNRLSAVNECAHSSQWDCTVLEQIEEIQKR